MRTTFLEQIALLGIPLVLIYGIYASSDRSYEDCILSHMKDAKTPLAADTIEKACQAKFKKQTLPDFDPGFGLEKH